MIRVLHVVGTMDRGGAETLIMNIYRNIDRHKVQFDFLCHNRIEAKYTEEILTLGGRMFSVPGISHTGLLKYKRNLYKFFIEHPEYQIVHSHQNELSGFILREANRVGVQNRCAHAHVTFASKNLLTKLEWKFFQRYFKENVTKAFACSILAGESLYKGDMLEKFEFIPNVVDVEQLRFNPEKRLKVREELGLGDNLVFGHVGRFAQQKNHKFLLEIFKCVLDINPTVQLLLIGEGKLLDEIKNYSSLLGIDNQVIFAGSRKDVPACMSAMDLFLFPSLYEGLSVACVEAQAAGLPILTTTSVSSEVALTELVRQEDLSLSANQWAEIAIDMVTSRGYTPREVYANLIKEAGFDAKELAKKMEDLYLAMSN